MNALVRLVLVVGVIFSGTVHAYSIADSFRFPLDNYVVGCNPYWGTCVKAWHLGEDAGAPATTKVKAIANGIVKEARKADGYGSVYIIEHTLTSGEKVVSVTGHLNIDSFTKKAGDEVRKGDILGEIGTSAQNGGWSEHVHTGIHKGAYGSGAKCGADWIYAGYTSCSSIKGEWYDPSAIILKFYSGSDSMCSRLSSRFTLCWKAGADSSCVGGKEWSLYDFDTASTIRVSDNHYCPVVSDGVGGSTTPPVTGSNNSGSFPDLVMRDVYLEDANYNRITRLHIGEKGHCHMSVINNGAVKAKGTFENRCWLSVGNQFDGKDKAEDIGKEDMTDLDNGQSRVSHEDFYAPNYPGTRNLVGCADASGKITELNEKNNCNLGSQAVLQEYRFEVWSSPNLTTTAIGLTNGRTVLNFNEPFVISSTTYNAGENFGQDYVYIGYFDNGVLIGQNQILRENMQGGYSKIETMAVPGGIATAGVHEIKACPDFIGAIAETNEADNCMTLRVEVRDPNISVTNGAFPCPVITPSTWGPPWSTQQYAPPFKPDGTMLITPWCVATSPNYVEVFVRGAADRLIYPRMRVMNQVTGAQVEFVSTLCSEPKQGEWCPGVANLFISGIGIDTSVTSKPTLILAYICQSTGTSWDCKWTQQAATIAAKQ